VFAKHLPSLSPQLIAKHYMSSDILAQGCQQLFVLLLTKEMHLVKGDNCIKLKEDFSSKISPVIPHLK